MAAETEHLTEQIDDILSTWRTDMVAQGADPDHIILKGVNKLMVHQGAILGEFLAQELDSRIQAYVGDTPSDPGDNSSGNDGFSPPAIGNTFSPEELATKMGSITEMMRAASTSTGSHEQAQTRVKSQEFDEEMDKKVQVTGISSQGHASGVSGGDWDGAGYKGGIVDV